MLDQPRLCWFYSNSWCKRGEQCKFVHARESKIFGHRYGHKQTKAGDPSRPTVASWSHTEVQQTKVRRSRAPGFWLTKFLTKHNAENIFDGRATFSGEDGQLVTFTLSPEPPTYIVQLMNTYNDGNGSQAFILEDSNTETRLHPSHGVPDKGFYCCSVWDALGTLVTGHLLGSNHGNRHGCFFVTEQKGLEEVGTKGAMFEVRLHGLRLGKSGSKGVTGVVPIGVTLTHGDGFMTDMWSHSLIAVTFCQRRLTEFFGAWHNANEPRLSTSVPELNVKKYSHRLINRGSGSTDTTYDEWSLRTLDKRCEVLTKLHQEYTNNHPHEMAEHRCIRRIVQSGRHGRHYKQKNK